MAKGLKMAEKREKTIRGGWGAGKVKEMTGFQISMARLPILGVFADSRSARKT